MHRTQGVDYVEEGGKRRYIDPNLPAVRGTLLNAESMNAIQEEICNVIEKAGLTLNSTAAADRADGWDQLWAAITTRGIAGRTALDNAVNAELDMLKYGVNICTAINQSTPGACWVKFAQVPIIASATKILSGRISHLGGDFPWNSRGMDFMVEIRDSVILCYSQSLRVFKTPGASDGSLYYKVNGENLELWAYTTASYPKLSLTPDADCSQYFDRAAEFVDTDPTGTTAFTEIAEDVIPDGSVVLTSLTREVYSYFATDSGLNDLASDLSTIDSELGDLSRHVYTYQGPVSHDTIQVWSDESIAPIATIADTNFVENSMLTIELGTVTNHLLTGAVWQVEIAPPPSGITTQYIRIKGLCDVGVTSTVNIIINDYHNGGDQISMPVIMPYNQGVRGYSPVIKLVKKGNYWTVA